MPLTSCGYWSFHDQFVHSCRDHDGSTSTGTRAAAACAANLSIGRVDPRYRALIAPLGPDDGRAFWRLLAGCRQCAPCSVLALDRAVYDRSDGGFSPLADGQAENERPPPRRRILATCRCRRLFSRPVAVNSPWSSRQPCRIWGWYGSNFFAKSSGSIRSWQSSCRFGQFSSILIRGGRVKRSPGHIVRASKWK